METSEAIKRRILALMAKTTENGCTEEEAISASKKVQELLHKFQLGLSDLKIKESKCTKGVYEAQQKADPMVRNVLVSIAAFTDTKVWKSTGEHGWVLYNFFGLEHDVMIAEYVTKICDWAIIYGGEDFKDTPTWQNASRNQRGKLKGDFQYGMAIRLSERFRAMKKAQQGEDSKTTGRDLVVVKGAVVTEAWAALNIHLTHKRSKARVVNPQAYRAGTEAGDKVALNPGVKRENRDQIQ